MSAKTLWISPTEWITGEPTLRLSYPSVHHPAVEITATKAGDLKWVFVGLRLPVGILIKAVQVCYQLSNKKSFISQVRLTEMQAPDTAFVRHDDATDLLSTDPTCYVSTVGAYRPEGAVTLALRLKFAKKTDKITLGSVGVDLETVNSCLPHKHIYRPEWWGAKGDDTTDDHAAIQAAINAAIAQGNSVVLFSARGYKLTKTLDIADADGLVILGTGQTKLRQATAKTRVFRVFGNSANIEITGLFLKGPHTAADNETSNGAAIVCGHENIAQDGKVVDRVWIHHNFIEGFRHAGIIANGYALGAAAPQKIQHLFITHNVIRDCNQGVFLYKNVHSALVAFNQVYDTWSQAYSVDTRAGDDTEPSIECSDILIANNVAVNTGVPGITAQTKAVVLKGLVKRVAIIGNAFRDLGASTTNPKIDAYGIFVVKDADNSAGEGLIVSGNVIDNVVGTSGTSMGISVLDWADVAITGNIIRNVKQFGIHVTNTRRFTIGGNTILNTGPNAQHAAIVLRERTTGAPQRSAVGSIYGNVMDRGTGGGKDAIRISHADDVTLSDDNQWVGYTNRLLLSTPNVSGIRAHFTKTQNLNFGSIGAGTTAELTVIVPGAVTTALASTAPLSPPEAGLLWSAFVSAIDTVTVRLSNLTAVPIDPAVINWRVDVWTH